MKGPSDGKNKRDQFCYCNFRWRCQRSSLVSVSLFCHSSTTFCFSFCQLYFFFGLIHLHVFLESSFSLLDIFCKVCRANQWGVLYVRWYSFWSVTCSATLTSVASVMGDQPWYISNVIPVWLQGQQHWAPLEKSINQGMVSVRKHSVTQMTKILMLN